MTIEEIDKLIERYFAASMKTGISGHILTAYKELYGCVDESLLEHDYKTMTDCRDSLTQLKEAIFEYGRECAKKDHVT